MDTGAPLQRAPTHAASFLTCRREAACQKPVGLALVPHQEVLHLECPQPSVDGQARSPDLQPALGYAMTCAMSSLLYGLQWDACFRRWGRCAN
jgi:hypothetical protein